MTRRTRVPVDVDEVAPAEADRGGESSTLLERLERETESIIAKHRIASPSLHAALLVAQRAVEAVAKASMNQHHRYRYASAEAMIGEARRVLGAAGLVCRRIAWQIDAEALPHPLVSCRFELAHPASGEHECSDWIPFPVIEANGRPFDKALCAALTTCWSYYLRDLLLIGRSDSEDIAARDDTEHRAPPAHTIGPAGAGRLRRALKAAGLDLGDLLTAMKAAGIEAPNDMALWPREISDRAETWIAKRTRERGVKEDAAPVSAPSS